jgi:hypothetical protein
MSIPPASAAPLRGHEQRRLLAAWVTEQTGRLDADACAALDAEQPDWRARATQLIAEGLLAYVVLEMIAPDLAIAQAGGAPADGHTLSDEALTKRLVAHLQDFIDYRAELAERGAAVGRARAHADAHHQRPSGAHEPSLSPAPETGQDEHDRRE